MARGRTSANTNVVASDQLLSALDSPIGPADPLVPEIADPALAMDEDLRRYHPEGVNRPSLMNWASDLVAERSRQYVSNTLYDISGKRYYDRVQNWRKAALAFRDPRRVGICIRRKVRREVIFALSPHRRIGGGGAKRRRRSWASAIRC